MTHLRRPRKDDTLRTLHLSVKGIYFQQMASGEKVWEYRLMTPHWRKRLEGREYDQIEIAWGYPASGDAERRMPSTLGKNRGKNWKVTFANGLNQ